LEQLLASKLANEIAWQNNKVARYQLPDLWQPQYFGCTSVLVKISGSQDVWPWQRQCCQVGVGVESGCQCF
jgi:hypothetical protein